MPGMFFGKIEDYLHVLLRLVVGEEGSMRRVPLFNYILPLYFTSQLAALLGGMKI